MNYNGDKCNNFKKHLFEFHRTDFFSVKYSEIWQEAGYIDNFPLFTKQWSDNLSVIFSKTGEYRFSKSQIRYFLWNVSFLIFKYSVYSKRLSLNWQFNDAWMIDCSFIWFFILVAPSCGGHLLCPTLQSVNLETGKFTERLRLL